MYVGHSIDPTLTVKATIPGNIVALAAFFGVKSASASGTFGLNVDGTLKKPPFVFPRTDIPQTSQDFPVTITVPLPALTRSTARTVTYKPGPVAINLVGYNKTTEQAASDGSDNIGNVDAGCTSDTPNQVIASVKFVKSSTALTQAVSYAKATKTLSTAASIATGSGDVATGSVKTALYRGKTLVKTIVSTLANGKSSATFTGVKKGKYTLVTSYRGSRALRASSATRTFTIR